VGTFGGYRRQGRGSGPEAPAITIVGDVVSLRGGGLDWYERRPLFGRRIVVTRARAQAGELSRELESLGAEVFEFPTIEIRPPRDFGPLDDAVRDLDSFDWLVFTSANGVAAFFERLRHHGLDLRAVPRRASIAAIGPATAEVLESAGLNVDAVPKEYRAESLLEEVAGESLVGRRVLIPGRRWRVRSCRRNCARPGPRSSSRRLTSLCPRARARKRLRGLLENGEVDCVTFTASSTVENFVGAIGDEAGRLLSNSRVACIGPITADAARGHGIRVDAEATEYTIPGLVEAVVELFASVSEPQRQR
jgi:uroporphyrinogen III methyltransferase/synthase